MNAMEGLRAAMAAVDAYYKDRGIFQGRFGFGKSPALVVIDMAYGWTDPAYAGGSARLDPAIDAIRQLLPVARGKRIPVVYTTSPFEERRSSSRPRTIRRTSASGTAAPARSTNASAPCPASTSSTRSTRAAFAGTASSGTVEKPRRYAHHHGMLDERCVRDRDRREGLPPAAGHRAKACRTGPRSRTNGRYSTSRPASRM